jgi:hypothetical protein
MAWAILWNTPLWVWSILAVLLALGLVQARNRKVSGLLILVLPATMIPLSLYGVAASFGASLAALSAWAIGFGAALTLNGFVFFGPRGVRYDAVDGRFEVPGSLVPLALMLTIFSTRFVFAVVKALNPSIVGAATFIGFVSGILGFCSGVFLSRAIRALKFAAWCALMRRARIGSTAGAAPTR